MNGSRENPPRGGGFRRPKRGRAMPFGFRNPRAAGGVGRGAEGGTMGQRGGVGGTGKFRGGRGSRAGPPVTPDGRYFVVRGRLWRCSDPSLPPDERDRFVRALMDARRAVGAAKRASDRPAEAEAHAAVDRAKRALGERGPVWWRDGAPDLNRHMARNTPYAGWFDGLSADAPASAASAPAAASPAS